jgi:hypothetical protein
VSTTSRYSCVHGTRYLYLAVGCRCWLCTAANTSYVTAWRHRSGRSDPNNSNRISHGISRYAAGCRCEVCRVANAASARRRRARKTGAARS